MLTSFSLTQLILISVAYLSTLFGIAWITERGYVPRRLVRHPLVYTLSLGVYASAWAFYGTVGLAYQYGYGFLAIYLGISGAFLLAPVLLYPILRRHAHRAVLAGLPLRLPFPQQHLGRGADPRCSC